jgi:Putative peptidoglycan binding domain
VGEPQANESGIKPEEVSCICPVHGTESVRWVQSTLNQILGLRLPVTGIMNAATRSAVRSFQQREGLPVDGIVGPDTERALSAARGGRSPQAGATKPAEPGMAEPAEPVPTLPGPDTAEPTPPAAEFDFEWQTFDDERELDFPEYEFEEEVARAAAPFGGDPALHQWATNLTTAWARRVTTKPDEQQREMKKRMDWLAKDYQITLAGAQKRKGLRKCNLQEIIRAWRTSREQHMDFATLDKSKELVNFQPPPVGSVLLVKAKDFVGDSDKYPVAPLVVAFMQKLLQIHPMCVLIPTGTTVAAPWLLD